MIYGGLFDLDSKIKRRDELDKIINSVDFWNSSNKDDNLREYNNLNSLVNDINSVKNKVESNIELLNMEIEDDMLDLINSEYEDIKRNVDRFTKILTKKFQRTNSFLLSETNYNNNKFNGVNIQSNELFKESSKKTSKNNTINKIY